MAYAAGQIHRNGCKNTHTLTPLFGIGVQAILLLALRCLFSFSTAVTKTGFAFLWRTGENEYRQKAFQSHTRKCGCRYPGGFQRRAGEACLWHTILLARSSVLYLLLRPNKAIRSCGRACAVTSTDDLVPPFPNETRFAGLSFGEGVGSECGMQWSMSFRRNKRYIKAPVSRPSSRRSAVSQKDAFKMQACFRFVCSECFQNESIFSRFTNPPTE